MYKLFLDTETGGTKPINSLLTAYFAIYDQNFNPVDELYLWLKPSDLTKLNVEQEALKVNGINIEEHLNNPHTVTYEEGTKKLIDFLNKYKIKGKKRSYRPCGHNFDFDRNFIFNWLMNKELWEKYIHYNSIDTLRILTFLQDIDLFPEDLGSLTSLTKYFNIPENNVHDAKGDVLMNVEVYKNIKNLLINMKSSTINIDQNLLEIIEK
jgi:hypothetical protein